MAAACRRPYRRGVVRTILAPWRTSRLWWSLAHLILDLPLGIAGFVVTFVLLAFTVSLLITFPLAFIPGALLLLLTTGLAALERTRFAALLEVNLANPIPRPSAPTRWGRIEERVRSRERWRQIGYLLSRLPMGVANFALISVAWCGSAALIGLPFYVSHLPGGTAKFGLFQVNPGAGAVVALLVGVIGLVMVAPWTTVGLAALDAKQARWGIGARTEPDLAARVEQLETSRTAVVDSAEAERRRIERDLHDGAQQRLIALAMGLGVARERFDTDPATSRRLVITAHEEAKTAIREIRDLVRGIHPAILEDRGLDAALSAVVARSPVPVSVQVEVPGRLSRAVESTAYFVVSEALANVTKHARASRAAVRVIAAGGRLHVEVIDDGVGGAVPRSGSGLEGLRDRLAGMDGTLTLTSPTGGPTVLQAELPFAHEGAS